MKRNPLGEVFGFPPDNVGDEAARYRRLKLCPFGNKVPNCTKDKASNPLGVCSIMEDGDYVITCPIRFREEWIIAEDAAAFLFGKEATWTTLTEIRLPDKYGKTAGNIDVVLVTYDERGQVTDFGALEVQAVYISGNIRRCFEAYVVNPRANTSLDWSKERNYPRADYLSSSRKRLAPQLLFKGGIFNGWGKRLAVALNRSFFATLPDLERVSAEHGDIAWLIYDLVPNPSSGRLKLQRCDAVYTKFDSSLTRITRSEAGNVEEFVAQLQARINKKLGGNSHAPDTATIPKPF